MDEFLKNFASFGWWVSVVGGSLVLHVLGTYLMRALDKSTGLLNRLWRRLSKRRQREHEDLVRLLTIDPFCLAEEAESVVTSRIDALYDLAFTILLVLIVYVLGSQHAWARWVVLGVLVFGVSMATVSASFSSTSARAVLEARMRLSRKHRQLDEV